jgi:hypothetical protein
MYNTVFLQRALEQANNLVMPVVQQRISLADGRQVGCAREGCRRCSKG